MHNAVLAPVSRVSDARATTRAAGEQVQKGVESDDQVEGHTRDLGYSPDLLIFFRRMDASE
jgi:hypothetical protein